MNPSLQSRPNRIAIPDTLSELNRPAAFFLSTVRLVLSPIHTIHCQTTFRKTFFNIHHHSLAASTVRTPCPSADPCLCSIICSSVRPHKSLLIVPYLCFCLAYNLRLHDKAEERHSTHLQFARRVTV